MKISGDLPKKIQHNKAVNTRLKISAVLLAFSVSACSTVKVPEFVNLPEFREASQNIGEYPDPADAPSAPDDMRGAADWDKAAKSIIKKRDGFDTPPDNNYMTDPQIEKEIEALKTKVKEYKLDDPVE